MTHPATTAAVLVIGGGHAACEAALAAARLGVETVLLTINPDHIAQMSCNPAIGGIGKGQLVREIDALGGEMARNTDTACLQFRMLNRSKGAAVQSPRAQCDKQLYQGRMKQVLESQPCLRVQQAQATRLVTKRDQVVAVETDCNETWTVQAVIIATGTFLRGRLHYGLTKLPGGRAGDPAAEALAESLQTDLRLKTGRLKTGTPPRILAQSIDFQSLARQDGDSEPYRFSFRLKPSDDQQHKELAPPPLPCYTTHSNEETAAIVRDNLEQSPLYSGRINGIGARYCPSFEDKIVRFPQHPSHLLHLEPEGRSTGEYYLNGLSTSLPPSVQWRMVRSVPGLKNAHITRYGYAIEYDFVFPWQLDHRLAVRGWKNLFLAGQINGTSGYEEAAAQGVVAGVNAARCASGDQRHFTVGRDQAYVGVMIDDLVTKDIVEPYRLFTSRAEFRLHLRQDNADLRLADLGRNAGLISQADIEKTNKLAAEINATRRELQRRHHQGNSLWALLRRPGTTYQQLPETPQASPRAVEQLQIEARYEGYIKRQTAQVEKMHQLEAWTIPPSFDYQTIPGLRAEARQKLARIAPENLRQAARIDGVTPAEIALLQVWLKRTQEPG